MRLLRLKRRANRTYVYTALGIFVAMPLFVFGAQGVTINEIAWMGTSVSSNNEWIELYNGGASDVNLDGWVLEAQDGSPKMSLSGTIRAGGFFLLERTDDETIPEVKADGIYAGALSNEGEVLLLKHTNGEVVDAIDALAGWQAGSNETKETMQRVGGAWVTAIATPKTANSDTRVQLPPATQEPSIPNEHPAQEEKREGEPAQAPALSPKKDPQPLKEFTVSPEQTKDISLGYSSSLLISEFLPNPKGADGEGEWIELYNDADTPQSLEGLRIDDQEGGSNPYKIPKGFAITSKGFMVFKRADTGIALNNDSDEVRILSQGGNVLASVSYKEAKEGYAAAYDTVKKQLYWTKTPTPGSINNVSQTAQIKEQAGEKPYQVNEVVSISELPNLDVKDLGAKNAAIGETPKASALPLYIIIGVFMLGGVAVFAYSRFL